MKHRSGNFKISKAGKVALSALYSLGVILVLTLIVSALSLLTKNPIATVGVMTIIIIVISSIISGVSLSLLFGSSGTQIAALASLFSSLVILAVGLIVNGGKISLKLPLNILIYILCIIISAHLSKPKGKKRRFS